MSDPNFYNVSLILEGKATADENILNEKRQNEYDIIHLNSFDLSGKFNFRDSTDSSNNASEVSITLIENTLTNCNLCNTFLPASGICITNSSNCILFYLFDSNIPLYDILLSMQE